MLSPGPFFLVQIYAPNCSAGGASPQTLLGSVSNIERYPHPLAGKGRGKEGKEGEGKGIGRGGKGSEGSLPRLKFKSGYRPLVCA